MCIAGRETDVVPMLFQWGLRSLQLVVYLVGRRNIQSMQARTSRTKPTPTCTKLDAFIKVRLARLAYVEKTITTMPSWRPFALVLPSWPDWRPTRTIRASSLPWRLAFYDPGNRCFSEFYQIVTLSAPINTFFISPSSQVITGCDNAASESQELLPSHSTQSKDMSAGCTAES